MHKLKRFSVNFTDNRNTFHSGKTLSGEVVLELNEPETAQAIRLVVRGEAYVHFWEQVKIDADDLDQHHVVPVNLSDNETYLNCAVTLWGVQGHDRNQDGSSELPSGVHSFPFSVVLPTKIPSSFETNGGYIRYWVKAQVHRMGSCTNTSKKTFNVIEQIDINRPELLFPMRSENQKYLCCCCCQSGPIIVSASCDRIGYSIGESVIISANADNQSSRELHGIRARLFTLVTLRTQGCETINMKVTGEMKGKRIRPRRTSNWINKAFLLPPTVPSIKTCRILDVSHYIQVSIICPRASNVETHLPILIGTVPLRSTSQIQFQNPIDIQNRGHPNVVFSRRLPPPARLTPFADQPTVPTYEEAGRMTNEQDDLHTTADYSHPA